MIYQVTFSCNCLMSSSAYCIAVLTAFCLERSVNSQVLTAIADRISFAASLRYTSQSKAEAKSSSTPGPQVLLPFILR